MGTSVMIGAGIFALTGQIAELAGPLFPLSFIAGVEVSALSSARVSSHVPVEHIRFRRSAAIQTASSCRFLASG